MRVNGINIEMPKISIGNESLRKSEMIDKSGNNGFSNTLTASLGESGDNGFGDTLIAAIEDINKVQVQSDKAVEGMLVGKERNIHETMVALEKADISLKLMVAVKNKAMDAYTTIMRMQ